MSLGFFFNDTATTEIYTLSLHDALPISGRRWLMQHPPIPGLSLGPVAASQLAESTRQLLRGLGPIRRTLCQAVEDEPDRKSTRLNSSHANISYAVFCLKKKKIVR